MDQSPSSPAFAKAQNIPLLIVWAVLVATCGGFGCGMALSRWGEFGSLTLWALGALSGYVGRRIIGAPSRSVGWGLVTANVLALVVAEVCWIHWHTVQGAESWWEAVRQLPAFVRQYEVAALIAAVFCIFGALSAYRQTAVRYRMIAID